MLPSDSKKVTADLKELVKAEKVNSLELTVYEDEVGPKFCKISKETEITIVIYRGTIVTANHVFADGKVDQNAIDQIVKDIKALLISKMPAKVKTAAK